MNMVSSGEMTGVESQGVFANVDAVLESSNGAEYHSFMSKMGVKEVSVVDHTDQQILLQTLAGEKYGSEKQVTIKEAYKDIEGLFAKSASDLMKDQRVAKLKAMASAMASLALAVNFGFARGHFPIGIAIIGGGLYLAQRYNSQAKQVIPEFNHKIEQLRERFM